MEIESAAARWKVASERSSFARHPTIMAVHFDGADELGSIWGSKVSNEGTLTMILGSPFAVSYEVTDTFLMYDRPYALLVSHLSFDGKGVYIADWRLPYSIDDYGTVTFGIGAKEWRTGDVRRACSQLASHRLSKGAEHCFDDAFTVAHKWSELHESQ